MNNNNIKALSHAIALTTMDSRAAGVGKSHDIIQYINSNPLLLFALVVPSIDLITQYTKHLTHKNYAAISGKTGDKVIERIKSAVAAGKSLVITQQAWERLNIDLRVYKYRHIFDEALQLTKRIDFTHELITDPMTGLKATHSVTPDFKLADWINIVEVVGDFVEITFNPINLRSSLINDEMIANLTNWKYNYKISITSLNSIYKLGACRVAIIAELKPELFHGAYIAAASFESTVMYKSLLDQQMEFIGTFQRHDKPLHIVTVSINGDKYFNQSKTFLNTTGKNVIPEFKPKCKLAFTGWDHLLVQNKDNNEKFSHSSEIANHNCHGINDFTGINHIYVPAMVRLEKTHAAYLKKQYGMSIDEIIDAYAAYPIYQYIMRLGIRTPTYNGVTYAWILDNRAAQLMKKYFSNVTIEYIDITVEIEEKQTAGVKKNPDKPAKTGAERKAKHDAKKKAERDAEKKKKRVTKPNLLDKRKEKLAGVNHG